LLDVSIHALRGECDLRHPISEAFNSVFNPRSQ